jgi:hypothetical protein
MPTSRRKTVPPQSRHELQKFAPAANTSPQIYGFSGSFNGLHYFRIQAGSACVLRCPALMMIHCDLEPGRIADVEPARRPAHGIDPGSEPERVQAGRRGTRWVVEVARHAIVPIRGGNMCDTLGSGPVPNNWPMAWVVATEYRRHCGPGSRDRRRTESADVDSPASAPRADDWPEDKPGNRSVDAMALAGCCGFPGSPDAA